MGRRDDHRTGSSEASLLLSTAAVDMRCLRPSERVPSWQLRHTPATCHPATYHAAAEPASPLNAPNHHWPLATSHQPTCPPPQKPHSEYKAHPPAHWFCLFPVDLGVSGSCGRGAGYIGPGGALRISGAASSVPRRSCGVPGRDLPAIGPITTQAHSPTGLSVAPLGERESALVWGYWHHFSGMLRGPGANSEHREGPPTAAQGAQCRARPKQCVKCDH